MKSSKKAVFFTGAITGFINGFFGSGGGTIAVPAMQKYLNIETHKSHATAIAVILPLSLVSLCIYSKGADIDSKLLFYVSLGGVAGGFIGAKMLNKIKSVMLHKIFGIFMIAASLRLIL